VGFLLVTGTAHTAGDKVSPVDPLPQDSGVAGLKQMLLRLSTTARLMQTTAHPDDEDGGMLTLESRGHGVATLLLTLTRGEGGQNKLGSNLFDVLGVLRTLELLASDRYYGVEQRFTRVADFGYSKNPEETFQKWKGHDIALGDMVRVIRTFRPDVLVAGQWNPAIASLTTSWWIQCCRQQLIKMGTSMGSSMGSIRRCRHWPRGWERMKPRFRFCGRRWWRLPRKLIRPRTVVKKIGV